MNLAAVYGWIGVGRFRKTRLEVDTEVRGRRN